MPLCLPSRVFAVGASFALAAAASAVPVFVGNLFVNDSYGDTAGGEFRMTRGAGFALTPIATGSAFQFGQPAAAGLWESFCLEKFEPLNIELRNLRADQNTETAAGANPNYAGGAHGGTNDPLDPRTAYLYDHFIRRTLITPYDYSDSGQRTLDANAMQTAMWFIEEEDSAALTGKALAFFNEAAAAVASGAWQGLGNVSVLNLYTLENQVRTEYQDQLILTPPPEPAPAGVMAISAGALALAGRRRRR